MKIWSGTFWKLPGLGWPGLIWAGLGWPGLGWLGLAWAGGPLGVPYTNLVSVSQLVHFSTFQSISDGFPGLAWPGLIWAGLASAGLG